jgi:hypothetical protein
MCSPSASGLQSFKVSTLLRSAQSASLRHLTEKPKRELLLFRLMSGLTKLKNRYQALPPLGEELHQ